MSGRPVPPSGVAVLLGEAVALHRKGKLAPAERLYKQVLALAPGNFDALQFLAGIAYQKEQFAEADRLLQRALAIKPTDPGALYNRGNVLKRLGRIEPALACYDAVLARSPAHPEALNDRGNVLHLLGRLEDADASYVRAIAARPGYAAALYNRANTLRALRRVDEAIAACREVLALNPRHADALNAWGTILADEGRHEEALAQYDRALAIDGKHIDAAFNRATALSELMRHAEAADAYATVLRLDPRHDYALGALFRARRQICDWRQHDEMLGRLKAEIHAGRRADIPLFCLAYADSPADELRCARGLVEHRYPPATPALWSGERYDHPRIRLGYFSADFRNHPSAYPMMSRFEAHDRSRFDVTAFSFGIDTRDEMRRRAEKAFDHFVDVREISDRDTAKLIRDREIDILVDLTGHTAGGRPGVLAWRPAPLQMSYLGYSSTMGAPYLDYILGDRHITPASAQPHYPEKIIELPGCFLPFGDDPVVEAAGLSRTAAGLPDDAFVFCAFTNIYKVGPQLFDVWMRLLAAVPGSVLWLLGEKDAVVANLRAEAARRGVSPDRLLFAGRVPARADHLARHALADLFLDTLPYNAHSTGRDALWAGLPVLTCTGQSFAGRVGTSLLHAAGLPELATVSLADYEAKGLELAHDRRQLAALRQRLAEARTRSTLFDSAHGRRAIEAAFVEAWQRWQRGEPPAPFAVNA